MVKTITFSGKDFAIQLKDAGRTIVENRAFLELYRETQHLMYSLMKRCYRFKVPLYTDEDMLREIDLAFMSAITDYDSTRGASFSTFLCLKVKTHIRDIYQSEIRLPLIKKYIADSTEDSKDKSAKEAKNGRSAGQQKRWRESAQMAYRLLTATYISEHEAKRGEDDMGRDYYDLNDSIRHSCSIEEDALFYEDED